MALIRFGGTVADIRGSIGGLVYSRSSSGATIRNRTSPVNPQTPAQDLVRSQLAEAAAAFGALTSGQLDQWLTFAENTPQWQNALGELFTPSRQQAFMRCNVNLLQVGSGLIPEPLAIVTKPALTSGGSAAIAGSLASSKITTIDLTAPADAGGDETTIAVKLWATPALRPSIKNRRNWFKLLSNGTPVVPGLTDDQAPAWKAVFGDPDVAPTDIITFRLEPVGSNGLAGDYVEISASPVLGP